jgi:tetratricopeptide (TPR) repeat protein
VRRAPPAAVHDSIVIADFLNTTADPVFDGTLKQALTVQLQQSPVLNVVAGEPLVTTLRLMRRRPDERLTPAVAREVCQRQRGKAMVAGSIAALGAQFVITLEAVDCVTGAVVATAQQEARGKENVLRALGTCASTIRERLGEALPSVQHYDVPIREAATGSLEALKLFSMAMVERDKGDQAAAVPLLRRAVELDPDFAVAWSHRGASLRIIGQKQKGNEATLRAFTMRDRAAEQERYYIVHRYYVMTGAREQQAESNAAWAKMFPRNWMPHDNLCRDYWNLGEPHRALAECAEALRLEPGVLQPYSGLVEFNIALGRLQEARAVVSRLLARGFADPQGHYNLARIAWLQQDPTALERETTWLRANAPPIFVNTLQYEVDLAGGRLRQANASRPVPPATLWVVGRFDEARRAAEADLRTWLRKEADPLIPAGAAAVVSWTGESTLVERLIDELERRAPEDFLSHTLDIPEMRAGVELAGGHTGQAIRLLESVRRYDFVALGCRVRYQRGRALRQAGRLQDAVREFQGIIAQPGLGPIAVARPLAWLELARTHAAMGNVAQARRDYERFFALWTDADPDLPLLQQAKQEFTRLGS